MPKGKGSYGKRRGRPKKRGRHGKKTKRTRKKSLGYSKGSR